jgi:hypothetical protein
VTEGARVFQNELGEWPEVYALLSDNRYILKAPYAAPDRAVWTGRMPLITGVVTVIALISWAVAGNLVEVVVGGLVAGFASVPVWRTILQKTVTLNFSKDLIAWRTPEGKNGTVELQGGFAANVQLPHRLAQEEIRVHQNYLRRRPATKTAPKSVYQVASEVIIYTGVGKREWLTVAAIADDESGEKAYRLKTAIEFVRDVVRAEAKEGGRAAPPSLPAASRSAAPPDERYE